MPSLKDVHEELQFISDRISTQVRSLAAAVIALVWLFLSGGRTRPRCPSLPVGSCSWPRLAWRSWRC
jgi:hypothetical protein